MTVVEVVGLCVGVWLVVAVFALSLMMSAGRADDALERMARQRRADERRAQQALRPRGGHVSMACWSARGLRPVLFDDEDAS